MARSGIVIMDASEMRRLHRALRDIDKAQARALTGRVRKIAKPLELQVKQAALNLESKTEFTQDDAKYAKKFGLTRLRAGIAAAVETRISSSAKGANARIRVSGTKFQKATGKPKKLPRYMEGLSRRKWRHPVFAHGHGASKGLRYVRGTWKGAWVEQKPQSYLLATVLPQKDEIREKLIKEYEDTFAQHLGRFGIPVR